MKKLLLATAALAVLASPALADRPHLYKDFQGNFTDCVFVNDFGSCIYDWLNAW